MNTENSIRNHGMGPENLGAFAEVMESLSPSEKASVDRIAEKVRRRVGAASGPAPKPPVAWGSVSLLISGVVLVGIAVWWFAAGNSPDAGHEVALHATTTTPVEANPSTPSPLQEAVAPVAGADHEEEQSTTAVLSNASETEEGNAEEPEQTAETPISADVNAPVNTTPEHTPKVGETENTTLPATETAPSNPQPVVSNTETGVGGSYSGTVERLVVKAKLMQKMGDGTSMQQHEMPSFWGGDELGLEEFVRSEVQKSLLSNPELKGQTAMVQFKVNAKGKVSDVEVINSDSRVLAAEVNRIFKLMPDWKKGSKKGKILCVVAITFDEPY